MVIKFLLHVVSKLYSLTKIALAFIKLVQFFYGKTMSVSYNFIEIYIILTLCILKYLLSFTYYLLLRSNCLI